jgi:hypothetical protein
MVWLAAGYFAVGSESISAICTGFALSRTS